MPEERAGIINEQSLFAIKEAYKALRTNITFSLSDKGCKIIGVTSAMDTEGKSINCLNLAISFGETGARVLLIDCDLRKPNIAKLLNEKASPGISNVLVNLSSLEEALRSTEYKCLDVILSGDIPPNASELLGSNKMAELLEELSKRYDYIFVDTPPVNIVSDSTILSRLMAGIVVIVKQGETDKGDVMSAIEQLNFVKAKVLGFVLNGVTTEKRGRYYRRYYTYESSEDKSMENLPKEGKEEYSKRGQLSGQGLVAENR